MQFPTLDKFPLRVLAQLDIQRTFIASRLIVAAERLRLFRVLHRRRMTAVAIARILKLHPSHSSAFLDAFVSLGLLHKQHDLYWMTRFAEKYFIRERSIYWTRQYSKECVDAYERLTVLEQMLQSGRDFDSLAGRKRRSYTESMQRDRREAEDFTQMLFHLHQPDAKALANYLDLSHHHSLLDACGGSGVMSIALARKNPHLRICLLDIPAVCRIAARNVKRAGLSRRVRTQTGDIRQPLPRGYDVIMFCDIGDVSPELLANAFNALPPGGLVVLADRYLSDDATRPLDCLLGRFVGSAIGRARKADIVSALRSCGFQKVKAGNVYQDVWFITGLKPSK